jgi:hypothetical protein
MREMRTSEKIGLISTLVGAVLTLAAGTGLSLLLNGFVAGFLALSALALLVLSFGVFRNFSVHRLQWEQYRGRHRLVQAERRETVEGPPSPPVVGYDERVPLARRRDDTRD